MFSGNSIIKRSLIAVFCMAAVFTWFACKVTAESKRVNMVVTAAFVSNKGIDVYEKMAEYMSKKLGWQIKVVSGLSYTVADKMLDSGTIQIGAVCGLPYVHKFEQGKYELLAVPVSSVKKGTWPDTPGYENVQGKYYSYTIVRKDSPINSWQELKGKSYAFNDKGSNSGYNMPRYKLVQLGARSWDDYFSKVVISGSHEESIKMVAEGMVDASSVDSLVLDYDRHIGDKNALNVKVIEILFPGGAGIPPIVFSKRADPSLKKGLQDVFLNMHKDPEGKKILDSALLLRFDPPKDSNYDDIRIMEEKARKAGFKDF